MRQPWIVSMYLLAAFLGNGAAAIDKMYWSDPEGIHRANLDGTDIELVRPGSVRLLALDSARGEMYFLAGDGVSRSNLDGSAEEQVFLPAGTVQGLAVDVEGAKIYWTLRGPFPLDKIQRANLDGTFVEDLASENVILPRGIAVDRVDRRVYWGDGIFSPRVQRAELDGSGRENPFTGVTGIPTAHAIAIDSVGRQLFISAGGHPTRITIDVGDITTVVLPGLHLLGGLAIDQGQRKLYYTDANGYRIRRVNFDGSGVEDLVLTGWNSPGPIALDLARDCDRNGTADSADVASGTYLDCNGNTIPDLCEPDCNANGIADECDILTGTSPDCDADGVPDVCQPDCNRNAIPDICDIASSTSQDCTGNRIPDECEPDCDSDEVADSCDLVAGDGADCDANGQFDDCEVKSGVSKDTDGNGIPDECDTLLFWVDRNTGKTQRSNRDGTNVLDIASGLQAPQYVAVDRYHRKVYWTGAARIRRANFDGSDAEDVPVDTALHLALDPLRDRLYWISDSMVYRSSLDGTGITPIFAVGQSAWSLYVEIVSAKLYWLEPGAIKRSNLDGTNVETLPITFERDTAYALVVNPAVGEIYWTEPYRDHRVRAATLDGSYVRTLVNRLEQPLGIAMDPADGVLYWAESYGRTIARIRTDGTGFAYAAAGLAQPWDVAVYTPSPDCNRNGLDDIEEIVTGAVADCTRNSVPDECEPDCNGNGVADSCDITDGTSADCNGFGYGRPDECDLADGTSLDCNANGVPDECDVGNPVEPPAQGCARASPPVRPPDTVDTNRYLALQSTDVDSLHAVRLTFSELPASFQVMTGGSMWLGPPREVSELSGTVDPPTSPPTATFWVAELQCEPHFADWSAYGTVFVVDRAIVPGGRYDLQAMRCQCPTDDAASFSTPLTVATSRWGNVSASFNPELNMWPEPEPSGSVDVVSDVVAVLNKFANRGHAISKARADVDPATPNLAVNITDVTRIVDAFRGLAYPFSPPAAPPCG